MNGLHYKYVLRRLLVIAIGRLGQHGARRTIITYLHDLQAQHRVRLLLAVGGGAHEVLYAGVRPQRGVLGQLLQPDQRGATHGRASVVHR